ncbi:MAG TPA: alpha/beta fold hydrolase [Bryobacteraceae bacterium]|nr:alpha/beta fold hydrolase [Bryobacteraceae bacterium]
MPPFRPLFRNPHAQTIAAHFWKRPEAPGAALQRRLFRTEPEVQVLVESQRPAGDLAGHLVLLHGLEGSGRSGYIRGMAAAAVSAGYAAHRFHMRSCGGTEHLCHTLYHAGLTSDLLAVLPVLRKESPAPIFVAGFSLGGNVALKLAGELGEEAAGLLSGVAAVSTPVDLEASARRIGHWENRLYERRFVRHMLARLRATGRFGNAELAGLRTLWEIDDRITAPSFGFGDALNYYKTQSALRYLPGLRIPVLLIQAKDDTFIPFSVFESESVRGNPWIRLEAPEHGGHLGFLARGRPRFWAQEMILHWMAGTKATIRPYEPS